MLMGYYVMKEGIRLAYKKYKVDYEMRKELIDKFYKRSFEIEIEKEKGVCAMYLAEQEIFKNFEINA